MKKGVGKVFEVGEVVLVPLADVNKAKVDAQNLTGISALMFSYGTGTIHYLHWHSKMVPVPVLAFLHFGSVPVWAPSITRTGIQQWFQYRYWNFCTWVYYQYWQGSLLVLAFNGA